MVVISDFPYTVHAFSSERGTKKTNMSQGIWKPKNMNFTQEKRVKLGVSMKEHL